MANIEVLGSIKELIRPILAEEGLSLFHSNFHIYRSRATLKLLVDKTHGGITLDSIVTQVRNTKQNVEKEIDTLVKRGILRKFEDEKTVVVDSLWVV